jgi:hypothetical protein
VEFSLADSQEILQLPRMNRWLPALLIVALLAGFRVLGSTFPEVIPNFQPLPAVFLCSLIFLKGAHRWLIPSAAWVITDPIASLVQGYPVFGAHHLAIALGLGLTVGIALWARKNPATITVLLSAVLSAAAFYFLTNLVSFAIDPLYAKTWEGFAQAQWTGPSGFGPTWIFLRNLIAGNLLFTSLFLAARSTLPHLSADSNRAIAR